MTAPVAELVIFDCDGVLVDSEPLAMRVLLETLAEAGVKMGAAEGYRTFLGRSLASVCELLRKQWHIEVDETVLTRMRERLYESLRDELRAMPGIVEVLSRLSAPFCVASSSQPERVALELEVTGLSSFFAGRVFCASMVERGKPAPDLFLHAAREMRATPARCIVIEDSPVGIDAAVDAGMGAFGFTGGSHAQSESHRRNLRQRGPRLLFDDMHELPGLLGEH